MRSQTTYTGSKNEHGVNIDVYSYIFLRRAFSGILLNLPCCIFTSYDELITLRGLASLTLKHFSIYMCVKLTTANCVVLSRTNTDTPKFEQKFLCNMFYGTVLNMLM